MEQNIKLKILKITKNIIRIRKLLDEIASIDVRYGILWQKVESRNGKADALLIGIHTAFVARENMPSFSCDVKGCLACTSNMGTLCSLSEHEIISIMINDLLPFHVIMLIVTLSLLSSP